MPLRLEVYDANVSAKLLRFAEELGDMESLWERLAGLMVENEEEWFRTHGMGEWPDLAWSTKRQKLRKGYPEDALIRTGQLFESLTDPLQAMDVGQGRTTMGTYTRNQMTWGTDVLNERDEEYAHYHQGTDPVTGEPVWYGNDPPQRQVIPWPIPIHWQQEFGAAEEQFVEECIRRSELG